MASIMRGLDAEAYDRQYSDKELLRRIFQYFQPPQDAMSSRINRADDLFVGESFLDVQSDH